MDAVATALDIARALLRTTEAVRCRLPLYLPSVNTAMSMELPAARELRRRYAALR